jgi:Flp pilus assembly protein TadG
MRTIHEHLRPRRGQSVVEFAFVSVIVLLLFFGTIDLGRGVFARSMLTNAVREGTRYGIVNASQAATPTTFQAGIASAAAQRSPILGLTTANFPTANITCAAAGSTTFTTTYCSTGPSGGSGYPTTTDTLKVCGVYTFYPVAFRLLGVGPISMTECSQALFQ